MQPTLNGIIGHPMAEAPPNILRQIGEYVVLGRNYINVVAKEDDRIEQIRLHNVRRPDNTEEDRQTGRWVHVHAVQPFIAA